MNDYYFDEKPFSDYDLSSQDHNIYIENEDCE
jgi:hypothetical protein